MKHKYKPILIKDIISMELISVPATFHTSYTLSLTTYDPVPYANAPATWKDRYKVELGNKKQGFRQIEFRPTGEIQTVMNTSAHSFNEGIQYTTTSKINDVVVRVLNE